MSHPIHILFVCMGNICRSPTAEVIFSQKIKDLDLEKSFVIESAGTHDYHVGEAPDVRSTQAAAKRGFDISKNKGRQVARSDLDRFDYLIAMDRQNYSFLKSLSSADTKNKIYLFLDFSPEIELHDVPDPYFGGVDGFEHVLDIIENGSKNIIKSIRPDRNQSK